MKVLSFDTETPIGETVHGPSFRDLNNDVYTQIWATDPNWVGVVHASKGFKRTLYDKITEELFYTDKIIGHNLSFDLCYVYRNKAIQEYVKRKGGVWDTQLAEYLLTGQQHTTSSLAELELKYLGSKQKPSRITYLYKKGIGADKIVAAKDRCPRLWKLYNEYCKSDGTTPLLIFKAQYIRAMREGMVPLIEMYNDYLLAQINMACTGIKIDRNKAEHLLRDFNLKYLDYLGQAQEVLKSVWTDSRLPAFNINSTDHKSLVLFGGAISIDVVKQIGFYKNGNPKYKKIPEVVYIPGYSLTKTLTREAKKNGFYSTDDKVLSAIKIHPNTPAEVLKYCELQELAMKYKKAAKTYCQAFIDRSVETEDGYYLYPHFNNTITPTGRLSSSEPNLQNIPSKDAEMAPLLMGCLVAPEGWKCVSIDFSQLEKWIQALVSQDINLTNALLDGICLHCLTLSKIEQLDYEYVYKKAKIDGDKEWETKRTNIKPVGFLMDYGGMEARVALETGLPQDQVAEIFRVDRELYPEKYVFFEQILPEAVKASATYSLACNIAASKTRGKDGAQLLGKAELLPIFDKKGNVHYTNSELRHVGYWRTNYGKKYHFCDVGRYDKNGRIRRNYPMPKFKNYPNQGGASDVQAATTAELLPVLLSKTDKIKMLLEIHDSKLFYIREDVLKPCIEWLKKTIEDVPAIFKRRFNVDIPFKFPVEIKIGDNFGEMSKYE